MYVVEAAIKWQPSNGCSHQMALYYDTKLCAFWFVHGWSLLRRHTSRCDMTLPTSHIAVSVATGSWVVTENYLFPTGGTPAAVTWQCLPHNVCTECCNASRNEQFSCSSKSYIKLKPLALFDNPSNIWCTIFFLNKSETFFTYVLKDLYYHVKNIIKTSYFKTFKRIIYYTLLKYQ